MNLRTVKWAQWDKTQSSRPIGCVPANYRVGGSLYHIRAGTRISTRIRAYSRVVWSALYALFTVNLHVCNFCVTSTLLSLLAVLVLHLPSLVLVHQHHPRYEVPFDTLHLVPGTSFLSHFINLIPVYPSDSSSSYPYHIIFLGWFSALSSLLHSFTPVLKPTSFTNPSHLRLPPFLRTDSMDYYTDLFSDLLAYFFSVLFPFSVYGSVRYIKLTSVSFWRPIDISYRRLSYRNVSSCLLDVGSRWVIELWYLVTRVIDRGRTAYAGDGANCGACENTGRLQAYLPLDFSASYCTDCAILRLCTVARLHIVITCMYTVSRKRPAFGLLLWHTWTHFDIFLAEMLPTA